MRDILPYGDEYNTTTQNKTKQLGWCGIIIGKQAREPGWSPGPNFAQSSLLETEDRYIHTHTRAPIESVPAKK